MTVFRNHDGIFFAACSIAAALSGPAFSESQLTGNVDSELVRGVDFRNMAFEECLNVAECNINGLRIFAQRQQLDGSWTSANIYWDPIDGLGVMGGQQNDEIDSDERLTVTFGSEVEMAGIWLSDLFIGEEARYQGVSYSAADVETAQITLHRGDDAGELFEVNGVFELPENPFEAAFTDMFVEGGDLLNRILVDTDRISIFMPGENGGTPVVLPLGDVDPAKRALFSENAVATIDIGTLLGAAGEVQVFEVGSFNASQIIAIRDDMNELSNLRAKAEMQRTIGDADNGELGWYAPSARKVDRIVFTSDVVTSNDYSVAGLITAQPFEIRVFMAGLVQ